MKTMSKIQSLTKVTHLEFNNVIVRIDQISVIKCENPEPDIYRLIIETDTARFVIPYQNGTERDQDYQNIQGWI